MHNIHFIIPVCGDTQYKYSFFYQLMACHDNIVSSIYTIIVAFVSGILDFDHDTASFGNFNYVNS